MSETTNKSSSAAPTLKACLLSSIEHVIKTIIYTFICHRLGMNAINSTSPISKTLYALIGIYTLSMIINELHLVLQRIQRKLPPGYFGFPILREIKIIQTISSGGIMKSLHKNRIQYGTFFTQSFFGGTSIIAGGQNDLNWIFNNDRKGLTDVAWPPNIVKLLGPGAVANQTGKYHRVLRRLLEPYFAPRFVANYLKCMEETTCEDLKRWCDTGEFHSSEVFKMYALRLFYVSAFGSVDEDMIASLHDDFKIWLGGFMSLTAKQFRHSLLASYEG